MAARSTMCRYLLSSGVISKFLTSNQPALRGITRTAVRTQHSAADNYEEEEGPARPHRLVVDPETSIRYMESNAYTEAYGDKPVWFHYRRNFKGQRAPETRKTCINVKLLEQFISPYTGEVLETKKTGICQKQHRKLLVAVLKAQDHGYLEKNVPFRVYDYSQYWDETKEKVL